MKKTFQKIAVTVAANTTIVLTEQLRQDYEKSTGFFVVPYSDTTNLRNISVQLKIAGYEILPIATDAIIATFSGNYPLKDSLYSFDKDSVPARSSECELTVTNSGQTQERFNAYIVLEN